MNHAFSCPHCQQPIDLEDSFTQKRAMKLIWSRREKQIEAVIDSTTCMVGAIGGIAEGVLLSLPELEFTPDEEAVVLE